MFNLSDNYCLRKCHFQREQVPTQSMIIKKMSPPLAAVYFKSMTPKLKVLAGLEPPLKGGGSDWYVPPKDVLEGRSVLKTEKKTLLTKLSYKGIDEIGIKCFLRHRKDLELEKKAVLCEADINWRKTVEEISRVAWEELSTEALKKNTEYIKNAFDYFAYLYRMTFNKFETLCHESAIAEINKTREMAIQKMQSHYTDAVKWQAASLYDAYTKKLTDEKARLKAEFIEDIEISRTDMADTIHDLNVDKHVAIEKLRQFFESQNMACQIYVALKEREECLKEMEILKHEHQKKVNRLAEKIAFKNLEIHFSEQKERRRREFKAIWQKKVCHVVKKFQQFVSYCLNVLPDHADFFINMEKLMLLQLNETLEEPTAESIIIFEERFHTPIPKPHPYYLFCDRAQVHKQRVDQDLCPKHCTSSASQLPVIIINKRCIYAACDNFQQFTNKMKGFVHGKRGDDADFKDDIIYKHCVPAKYTSSQQLLELKLESSLLQVLQQEIPNIKEVPIKCSLCQVPHCFCSPRGYISVSDKTRSPLKSPRVSDHKLLPDMRKIELNHEREPKWESFLENIEPKKCACVKTAKKHLIEHLPVYMRHMSKYEAPDLLNYEKCSATTLKKLVHNARGHAPAPPSLLKVASKAKDVGTQYFDPDFVSLCNCFSDSEVDNFFSALTINSTMCDISKSHNEFRIVDGSISSTHMTHETSSFATARAYSLRNIVDDLPDLQEIFKKKDCTFE